MSLASSGNSRYPARRDITASARGQIKCRIPQRLQSLNKTNIIQTQKPKSVVSVGRATTPPIRGNKTDRTPQNSPVKVITIAKRVPNKQLRSYSVNPRPNEKAFNNNYLPNQAALKKEEELEVQQGQLSYDDFEPLRTDVSPEVRESVTSIRGKLVKLKISWQEQMDRFEKMKSDLGLRQGEMLKLYASICKTHKDLLSAGQKNVLPPPDELSIMNVAQLMPEQLLQLCADAGKEPDLYLVQSKASHTDSLAVNKFYDVSSKLVDTCKQALEKRKSIIDWFHEITNSGDKGININVLNRKVREFNTENENLKKCLEGVRSEFYSEMKVIVEYFRKAVNDAINNQLHAEDLTCKLSELNAQNIDLKKTLYSLEHTRISKNRIDDLERELSEEKRKRATFKERADIAESKLSEKELALENLTEHAAGLEQTIQELNDQNQRLQINFDKELNNLNDSIIKNTENLKEIATAREKLQEEKENSEKRYKEQTDQYLEDIKSLKQELKQEIEKRIVTDEKYLDIIAKRKLMESMVENLQKQVAETDKRYADSVKIIQNQQEELGNVKEQLDRLEVKKRYEVDEANKEIDNYKTVIETQNTTILKLEQVEKETLNQLDNTKQELESKAQYIASLEMKQNYLENQLKDSEMKLSSYEEQLSKIKSDINSIQDACGYFENLDELNEMINQQRLKLDKTTEQIKVLNKELELKECNLKAIKEKVEKQESELNEKDVTIKSLVDKDEDHKSVIKLMKENFEMRTQTDAKLNRELADKDAKINALINVLEVKEEQIVQLNKIVITLKEQAHKQKNNDREVISMLEQRLADIDAENRQSISNSDNFDNLLQILEDELQPTYKNDSRRDSDRSLKRRTSKEKRNKHDKYCHEQNPSSLFETDHNPKATKIVMGNFVKKTYISSQNDESNNNSEDLNRKKAIMSMDTQRWLPLRGTGVGAYDPTLLKNRNETYNGLGHLEDFKERYFSRNLPFVIPSPLQKEKQSRMFGFAKHRM